MEDNTPHTSRRNLIIVSMLVSFFYYAEVDISAVKFVGAIITFRNLNAIEHAMWVIWIYVYTRYLLVYIAYGRNKYHVALVKKLRDIIHPELLNIDRDLYTEIKGDDFVMDIAIELKKGPRKGLQKYSTSRLLKKNTGNLKKQIKPPFIHPPPSGVNFVRRRKKRILICSISNMLKFFKLIYFYLSNLPKLIYSEAKKFIIEYLLGFRFWSYDWIATSYHLRKQSPSQDQKNTQFTLSGRTAFKILFKSHLKVITTTPEFIEHKLPLIIGLLPLVFAFK